MPASGSRASRLDIGLRGGEYAANQGDDRAPTGYSRAASKWSTPSMGWRALLASGGWATSSARCRSSWARPFRSDSGPRRGPASCDQATTITPSRRRARSRGRARPPLEQSDQRVHGPQGLAAKPPPRAIVLGYLVGPPTARSCGTSSTATKSASSGHARYGGRGRPMGRSSPRGRGLPGGLHHRRHDRGLAAARRLAELLDLGTEPSATEYDAVVVGAGPPVWPRRCTARLRALGRW